MQRKTKRTLPPGQLETFAYDLASRQTSHTDFRGKTTTMTYDSRGNRTSPIYADGSVERPVAYDDAGDPLQFINRRGQIMSYQYNAAGRVTSTPC